MNAASLSPCIDKLLGTGSLIYYVVGHGLGGSTAVVYHNLQLDAEGSKLEALAKLMTYGAPSVTDETEAERKRAECKIPGSRYVHINDPMGSTAVTSANHDEESLVIYDDVTARRRWQAWKSRRRASWQWTKESDANCNEHLTLGFSAVDAAVANHISYDAYIQGWCGEALCDCGPTCSFKYLQTQEDYEAGDVCAEC